MSNPFEEKFQKNKIEQKGSKYLVARSPEGNIIRIISGPFFGDGSISDEATKEAKKSLNEGEVCVIASGYILRKAGLLEDKKD